MGKKQKSKSKQAAEPNIESLGAFPQINATCSIKSLTAKKGGQDPRFGGFKVSDRQAEILLGLVNSGEEISLTIAPVQGRLLGTT